MRTLPSPTPPSNADRTHIASEGRRNAAQREFLRDHAETTAAALHPRPGPVADATFARLMGVTDDPDVRRFLRRMLAVHRG